MLGKVHSPRRNLYGPMVLILYNTFLYLSILFITFFKNISPNAEYRCPSPNRRLKGVGDGVYKSSFFTIIISLFLYSSVNPFFKNKFIEGLSIAILS